MDITNLSDVELKAMAYDRIANIEVLQKDLNTINRLLAIRAEENSKAKQAALTTSVVEEAIASE